MMTTTMMIVKLDSWYW